MSIYSILPESLQKVISPTFFRYGIMAVVVVGIEIAAFWVLNSLLNLHYLIATNLSLLLGIILNWLGSRYFVFGSSNHPPYKEFGLVFITSFVGIVLQSTLIFIIVEFIKGQPLVGKTMAIIITFFWNYLARKYLIYSKSNNI